MEHFLNWLDGRSAEFRQKRRGLTADGRKDEGDLMAVRANVYGICKSVLQVLDREKAVQKLNGLHTEWTAALQQAEEHGDARGTVVGENKLAALTEIMEKLKEV